MTDVNSILKQRGETYGNFERHAKLVQSMKSTIDRNGSNWVTMRNDQREALEMIFHKLGRILNGDPNHIDSWDDIAGYATLVANRLREEKPAAAPNPRVNPSTD